MYIREFPGCCTAVIIASLGPANASYTPNAETLTKEELDKVVMDSRISGNAVITAMTNSEQKEVNKILKGYGFLSSGWLSKEHHPETKVKLWWYPLKQ